MTMTWKMSAVIDSDAQLVESSLTGNREAFARIVARYRSLVCSITYNVTGSLSLSEDLAQETFLAAWKQLAELREPSQLRSWLCGITRFMVGKELRRRDREPIYAAEPLDAIREPQSLEPSPAAQAVSREEEVILWRALERVPEVYREPLILFYREQQSVERVAVELELSEDTVKQRLSRGRKLLHEEVITFVEGALSRTAPGKLFSEGVLALLPAGPGATAGIGIAGKGAAAAKSGFLGGLLGPILGMVGGVTAHWLIVEAAPTARERRVKGRAFLAFWIFVLAWAVAGQAGLRAIGRHQAWSDRTLYSAMSGFWWFSAMVTVTWAIVTYRQLLAIREASDEQVGTRLTWRKRAAVVAGSYLSCFSWLIALAWRAHDPVSAGIISAAMVALGLWHFFQIRGRKGTAGMRVTMGRMSLACGTILLILNLRLDAWLAAIHGTNPLSAWVIPSLTLALLVWVGVLFAVTKPKHGLFLSMFLAGCFLAFSQTPPAAIPDQYRPLYQELDATLHQASQLYPFKKGAARPLVAPNLLQASSMYAPAASGSPRWKDLLDTLDAFKAMGSDAVFVQILAPDLVLGDTAASVDFYQRLADEIRARKMKLYVEHFVNTPFVANHPRDKHAPPAVQDFLKIMEQEAALIYREIKPDYLTLVNEPVWFLRGVLHLSFSSDELAGWIGELTAHLKSSGASPNTLLGAGAELWEPETYVLKFAKQANLDYVDIHMYALKVKGEGSIAKLASLVHQVREARPNMKIMIGEAWLMKDGGGAPNVNGYQDALARNDFSFWSPLDEQFLNLLMGFGQKENISAVVPFFSQYFFGYFTFGDAESAKLPPWPRGISESWNKALESVRSHQLSPTGKAMRAMLDDNGK
jgi:RNA polymerase sigma factor (sigma-70 family)